MEKVEKLFKDAEDSNGEIGWIELKSILDGAIPNGNFEMFIFHYKNQLLM